MKLNRLNISIGVLILFHAIGIIGTLWGDATSFLRLTPLNLLLTFALILLNHSDWKRAWVLALTFVIGFLVEVLGVNSDFPFGAYTYGPVLGWQVWNTPLMIGVNWLILLYGANSIGSNIGITPVVKAIAAASFMVMIDILIEPVAIQFDFWTWAEGEPPLANYLGWFGVAFILSLVWQLSGLKLNRSMGIAVLSTEAAFFLMLNSL